MSLIDLVHQLSNLVGMPAAFLAGIAAAFVVIARDWRLVLLAYLIEAVMLALLSAQVIPAEWALLQVIVAGLIGVMIFLSAIQLRNVSQLTPTWSVPWPQVGSLTGFRFLAVLLTLGSFVSLRDEIFLPVVQPLLHDVVLWLALVGLLGLALHEEPLHAGLSLLTLLGGCQLLIFALMQQRVLVGLLGAGQLLLGLAISYLILARGLGARAASSINDHGREAL